MKVTIPYTFSQPVYLINDQSQREYLIYRMIVEPNNIIVLDVIDPDGERFEFSELVVTAIFDSAKDEEYRKRNE